MQIDFLEALKNYLGVFNIAVHRVSPPYEELVDFDLGLRRTLDPQFDSRQTGEQLLRDAVPNTLSVFEDRFGARYGMFPAPCGPDQKVETVFLFGPWRGEQRSPEQTVWARHSLGAESAALAQRYYALIPQVEEQTVIGSVAALVSMLYPPNAFRFTKLRECGPLWFEPDMRILSEQETLRQADITRLEERYAAENLLIEAVACGDLESAWNALRRVERLSMLDDFSVTLSQCKNRLIVLNTLLRKAIERTHMHPCHIEAINRKYTASIEVLSSVSVHRELLAEMLEDYCACARHYSVQEYSPLVQKVVNFINLNLDARLSLRMLAERYFISPSYLSNLFKQETGYTLTDYINTQRIQRAAQRLQTTNSSVATIAESVGILDVNYFTKIFKRVMGTTPTQYRRAHLIRPSEQERPA